MICWAFSGLSQKFAWPIWSLSRERWESLLGTSKTVPELRNPAKGLVGSAAQIGVHENPREKCEATPGSRAVRASVANIAKRTQGGQLRFSRSRGRSRLRR